MKKALLFTLLVLATLVVACSDQERGQVILTIASANPSSDPFGDILTNEGTIPPDTIDLELHNDLKNPDGLASTTFANVQLESITCSFTRVDGGSDKPNTFRTTVSYSVPANGVTNIEGFVIVPATMKTQFPISDLIFYGYERNTNFVSIRCDVLIEIEGKTLEGDPVYASGSITIEFADYAD